MVALESRTTVDQHLWSHQLVIFLSSQGWCSSTIQIWSNQILQAVLV